MNEKLIEKKVCAAVRIEGGEAIKLLPFLFTGLPDRLVLLPGGRVCFAELKTTGAKLRPRQVVVIAWLRKLGFEVFVIDDAVTLSSFITAINLTVHGL